MNDKKAKALRRKAEEMTPRRALVLVGPEGCGKSALARDLAKAAGTYCVLHGHELDDQCAPWSAFEREPVTCIIEELPRRADTWSRLKLMITNPVTMQPRKNRSAAAVKSPQFIFCTNDPASVQCLDARRFKVVRLTAEF